MKCLLVYDISHDATRSKIADFCLDYGLDRIQYSAFLGDLARTHQEELILRISERLGEREGKIQLFVICEKDFRVVAVLELDDRSHDNPRRQESDGRKAAALEGAGIPLHRVNVNPLPHEVDLSRLLGTH